jgi:excisionase family DNA binding protein
MKRKRMQRPDGRSASPWRAALTTSEMKSETRSPMRGQPQTEAPALLLSVAQAAMALSIGQRSLYPLLMRGEIRSVTIGRRRLVPVAEIEHYIARLLESG